MWNRIFGNRKKSTQAKPAMSIHEAADPEMIERASELATEILQPENRPTDEDPLFTAIATQDAQAGKLRILSFGLADSQQRYLFLFSSLPRSVYYAERALGEESAQCHFQELSAANCAELVLDWMSAGITDVILDRCPHCETATAIPLPALKTTEDWFKMWAATQAARFVTYDRYVDQSLGALEEGRLADAASALVEVVEHLESARPEVHSLLGIIGVITFDDSLTQTARANLESCDEHWIADLDEVKNHTEPIQVFNAGWLKLFLIATIIFAPTAMIFVAWGLLWMNADASSVIITSSAILLLFLSGWTLGMIWIGALRLAPYLNHILVVSTEGVSVLHKGKQRAFTWTDVRICVHRSNQKVSVQGATGRTLVVYSLNARNASDLAAIAEARSLFHPEQATII